MSEPLIRMSDMKAHGVPFSRATIYRLINAGEFPPPVKLGKNTSAWLFSEIDAWLKTRIAARDSASAPQTV